MATAPARVRDSQVDAATSRPRDPASWGSADGQSDRCDGVFDGLLERVQELRTGRAESEQSRSEDDGGRRGHDTEAHTVPEPTLRDRGERVDRAEGDHV